MPHRLSLFSFYAHQDPPGQIMSLDPLRTVSCPQKESLKLRSRYHVNGRCLVMAFRTHYPKIWHLGILILSQRNFRQWQKQQNHSCFNHFSLQISQVKGPLPGRRGTFLSPEAGGLGLRRLCEESSIWFHYLLPTAQTSLALSVQFSSVAQSCPTLCNPMNCSTPGSLSITNSRSSLRLTSIKSVMPSSHLMLCCPLLLLPPIPPNIRVFSNESTLRMRWPKYWSFSFSIIPSKENPGLISFRS